MSDAATVQDAIAKALGSLVVTASEPIGSRAGMADWIAAALREEGYVIIPRTQYEALMAAYEAPRPMTGFFAGLTPEQQKEALEYRGEDTPAGTHPTDQAVLDKIQSAATEWRKLHVTIPRAQLAAYEAVKAAAEKAEKALRTVRTLNMADGTAAPIEIVTEAALAALRSAGIHETEGGEK